MRMRFTLSGVLVVSGWDGLNASWFIDVVMGK